jgi:putative tryptophan/tyrosine transport system substrate-binding protein
VRRRAFITLLGGAAATWPLAARAQPAAAAPVIGFLRSASLTDATHLVAGFRQGLNDGGFVEGRNVAVEYRSADGHNDRLPALIADLLGRQVAVIVANSIAARVVRTATTTVPIVFAGGGDPVKDGLVTSLNRPGGNITGVVFFSETIGTKRLELLRQLVPRVATIGVLVNPATPGTVEERGDIVEAAKAMGQELIVVEITSGAELETAFATFQQRGAGALLTGSGALLNSYRDRVVALAAQRRLPALYSLREFVSAGGLMSYGTSITEAYRQAGVYAGRILKGEKPGELPVMRATKFEFVLNLKTAKALGLEVPDRLLALADEVIE